MLPALATALTILVSIALMRLDRDTVASSRALWIPLAWLLIASSRPVSNWVTFGSPVDASTQYIDGSPIDRNVLTCLVVFAFVILARRSRKLRLILRANTAIVLFFGFCLLSILWADYPFVLLKRWIRALADLAMVCIILTDAHPMAAVRKVLTWLASILLPLSILFTRFFPSLGRSYTAAGVPMWTGVATDKNALGALCMITGVFLLARGLSIFQTYPRRKRTRPLVAVGILFSMAVYLLGTIDSKTALACFGMASLLIILRRHAAVFRKPFLVTVVVLGMIWLCYSILFLGMGSSTLSEMGRDTSLTGRTQVWQTVLPLAVNPWIGAGFENFWIGKRLERIIEAVGAGLNQAHNGYIEIYLNLGWIGVFLLAVVLVAGFRNVLTALRERGDISGLKLAFFLICIVYNFTEAAFKIMSPVWICFLWATVDIPASGRNAPSSGRTRTGVMAAGDNSESSTQTDCSTACAAGKLCYIPHTELYRLCNSRCSFLARAKDNNLGLA